MPLADYTAFLQSLGWLAALMFAALGAGLPDMPGRRHAGWLTALCATRLLVAAQALVLPQAGTEWRQFVAVASGGLLWEFARRVWNDSAARQLAAATHLVALEIVVLVLVTGTPAGSPRPAWLFPIDLLFAALPVLLGGVAALLLWSRITQPAARVAAVGVGFFGAASVSPLLGALSPWLVAVGLAWVCFAVPATRTRPALACAAGLLLAALVGPLAVAAHLRQLDNAANEELFERVRRAVAPLQGRVAARLADSPAAADTLRVLHQHLENLRASDPLLHEPRLWQLRGDRVWTLGPGGFVDTGAATPGEREHASGLRAFVSPATAERAVATAHAPLLPGAFETPTAWLTLAYPAAFWEVQRQHARRTGVALIGVFAGFCAMGFVLAGRQAIENAQRLAAERAASADKAKTEFLTFLSHELRTPLQTILGRAELLRAQPAAERHAAAIETQGRLLLRLVTDLLDLGTIEAGQFLLRSAPFSLRSALAAVEDTVRAPAADKNLTLTISVDPAVPDAFVGDEARLRQILGNLLGNAVKYTARGMITLHVTRDPSNLSLVTGHSSLPAERLAFEITDTGPGLPPDKISQLFTLFTRLDSGGTFTREGTGVGLALVRRLCTLMGGTVAAANRPEGGAEFTVRLAFPFAEKPSPSPGRGCQSIVDDVPGPIVAGRPAPTGLTGLRVLLAEDNTATRELLTEALAALGHEVTAVADGTAALSAAGSRPFNVAVLDINLPGVDGVALARQLRARQPATRLIACSAEALPAVREAALAAGFDAFLVKPVSLEVLTHAVAPASHPSPASSLFDRLNSPEAVARTRALLTREWPRLRAETEAAVAAGDTAAPRRLSHYLQSSALLLADAPLLELCRRLSAAPASATGENPRAPLDEIAHHFAAWPAPLPSSPSSATTRPT